jgi:hypothetical protein
MKNSFVKGLTKTRLAYIILISNRQGENEMAGNIFDNKDAMWFLMEAMSTGDSGKAVENQEKNGQMMEANRQTLPRDMRGITQEQMEGLGFVFGEPADDLFVYVTFPAGWTKRPTEHSMHTDIVDDKGRRRGGIFYKAAYYDRSAHMSMATRFTYGTAPVCGYGDNFDVNERHFVSYVNDCGQRIAESDPVEILRGEYQKEDALIESVKAWLAERYPLYDDPIAYWDED